MMDWILSAVVVLCAVATILPLNLSASGMYRCAEFPRIQIAAVSLLCLVASVWVFESLWLLMFSAAISLAVFAFQTTYLLRFTPLWRAAIPDGVDSEPGSRIRILISNVKQSNRQFDLLGKLVIEHNPDIAVFVETDENWIVRLRPYLKGLDHTLECPQDNSYGMLLASRLALKEARTRYLINDKVPSLDCTIEARNGRHFRLLALHPEPPVPVHSTTQRDGELALAAKLAATEQLPMIVTGDLNDVAWSCTTRRFVRLSGLGDPRQGRGLFNTFDARFFFLRWPLDHIFLSTEFRIFGIRRFPYVGSDHFPIMFELALDRPRMTKERGGASRKSETEESRELIQAAIEHDRAPVGTDWETSE